MLETSIVRIFHPLVFNIFVKKLFYQKIKLSITIALESGEKTSGDALSKFE